MTRQEELRRKDVERMEKQHERSRRLDEGEKTERHKRIALLRSKFNGNNDGGVYGKNEQDPNLKNWRGTVL